MSDEQTTNKRNVPMSALRFTAHSCEFGDNGDDAKTAPFRMVARSGQPIEHWYWGRIVHDLSGMRAKKRVPIDYNHEEEIGFANHFNTESGDLEVSGAVVPYKDSDRANRVLHMARNGIPYEASINFGGSGIKLQNVEKDEQTEVNGYTFDGPGVVVREWPLRGVAICPYGADHNTSTEFSKTEQCEVEFMATVAKRKPEELEAADVVAVETESVCDKDAEAATEAKDTDGSVVVDVSAVEATEPEAELTEITPEVKLDGLRFLKAFGDQGGVWFAQGLTFEQAQEQFVAALKDENKQLRAKLSSIQPAGEEEPVAFSEAKPQSKKMPVIRIAGKVYE